MVSMRSCSNAITIAAMLLTAAIRRLKQRIAGRFGHLANDAAAELLSALDRSRLKHVIAAHLSEQNNRPNSRAPRWPARWHAMPGGSVWPTRTSGFDWRELA